MNRTPRGKLIERHPWERNKPRKEIKWNPPMRYPPLSDFRKYDYDFTPQFSDFSPRITAPLWNREPFGPELEKKKKEDKRYYLPEGCTNNWKTWSVLQVREWLLKYCNNEHDLLYQSLTFLFTPEDLEIIAWDKDGYRKFKINLNFKKLVELALNRLFNEYHRLHYPDFHRWYDQESDYESGSEEDSDYEY